MRSHRSGSRSGGVTVNAERKCCSASSVAPAAKAASAARSQPQLGLFPQVGGRPFAERLGERDRLTEVVGDQLGQDFLATLGSFGEPAPGSGMELRPLGARQSLVGDLADQDVAERVAVGARWSDEIAIQQGLDGFLDLALEGWVDSRHACRPECPTKDGSHLQHAPGVGRKLVQSGEHRRLDVIGQSGQGLFGLVRPEGARLKAVGYRAHDLAGEERVAFGALDHGFDEVGRSRLEQVPHECGNGPIVERLQRQREMVAAAGAPRWPALEQFGPGEDHHQERQVAMWLDDVLDEVEQAVARPVQVFEYQDERMARRGQLDGRPPGAHQSRRIDRLRFAGADRRRQQVGQADWILGAKVLQPPRNGAPEFARRGVLVDVGEPAEHGTQRPVRQPLAVREALRDGDAGVRLEASQPVETLLEQSCLARPCRRDDAYQVGPTFLERATGRQLELRQVGVTTDDRHAPGESASPLQQLLGSDSGPTSP